MNQFQTREERKPESRQSRRRDFWITFTILVCTLIIAAETRCESGAGDPPMFVQTELSE